MKKLLSLVWLFTLLAGVAFAADKRPNILFFLAVAHRSAPKLEQAVALQKTLRVAGVRCELFEAPEHDHNSLNRAIGVREDAVTQAMETFHDSLRGDTAPAAK